MVILAYPIAVFKGGLEFSHLFDFDFQALWLLFFQTTFVANDLIIPSTPMIEVTRLKL